MSPQPAALFEWRVLPVAEAPGRSAAAIVVIIAFSVASALFGGDIIWGLVAALILLVALNRFFMPSRYQVTEEALLIDQPLRRRAVPWDEIRLVGVEPRHIVLFTAESGRHGIPLLAPADASGAIAALREHLRPGCEIIDRRAEATREIVDRGAEASP